MAKVDPVSTIPSRSSLDSEWIAWHKSMRKYFGKQKANELFLKRWNKQAGYGSKASTSSLINYMESQGVDLEKSLLQSVGGIFGDLMGVVRIVAVGAGVVVGGYLIWQGYKYYQISKIGSK